MRFDQQFYTRDTLSIRFMDNRRHWVINVQPFFCSFNLVDDTINRYHETQTVPKRK